VLFWTHCVPHDNLSRVQAKETVLFLGCYQTEISHFCSHVSALLAHERRNSRQLQHTHQIKFCSSKHVHPNTGPRQQQLFGEKQSQSQHGRSNLGFLHHFTRRPIPLANATLSATRIQKCRLIFFFFFFLKKKKSLSNNQ
jgi:hypothetical protein